MPGLEGIMSSCLADDGDRPTARSSCGISVCRASGVASTQLCVSGGEEPFGVKSGHGIDNSLIATHWGIPSCVKPGVLRVFMAVKGLRSWAFRNTCCGKSQARDLVLPVEAWQAPRNSGQRSNLTRSDLW